MPGTPSQIFIRLSARNRRIPCLDSVSSCSDFEVLLTLCIRALRPRGSLCTHIFGEIAGRLYQLTRWSMFKFVTPVREFEIIFENSFYCELVK